MTIVCSKWAERLPSTVTAVQPSSSVLTAARPAFTIGSMASTIPGRSQAAAGRAEVRHLGGSCSFRPIPWPTKSRTTAVPERLHVRLYRESDVAQPAIRARGVDGAAERLGVVASRRAASDATAPTGTVRAESPKKPL